MTTGESCKRIAAVLVRRTLLSEAEGGCRLLDGALSLSCCKILALSWNTGVCISHRRRHFWQKASVPALLDPGLGLARRYWNQSEEHACINKQYYA